MYVLYFLWLNQTYEFISFLSKQTPFANGKKLKIFISNLLKDNVGVFLNNQIRKYPYFFILSGRNSESFTAEAVCVVDTDHISCNLVIVCNTNPRGPLPSSYSHVN